MTRQRYITLTSALFLIGGVCGLILGETDLGFWKDWFLILPFAFAHTLLCSYIFEHGAER